MFEISLFLGCPVESSFAIALESVDPRIVALFIQDGDVHYLQEIIHEGKRYIGKFTEQITDIASLSLMESNIHSLLKKVVSGYPCEDLSLYLIPAEITKI